jgi:hypothetical protein
MMLQNSLEVTSCFTNSMNSVAGGIRTIAIFLVRFLNWNSLGSQKNKETFHLCGFLSLKIYHF